jgi:hypothetical protein
VEVDPMAVSSKPRPRVKPELEARLGPSVPGVHTVFLHRGAECHGYYVRRLPSDFGLAYGLDKFGAEGAAPTTSC